MSKVLQQVRNFFNQAHRLSLNHEKQEKLVWQDLKKLHSEAGWESGVYEADKYIDSVFPIADETPGFYRYFVSRNELFCQVKVLENYYPEKATDIFLLASHFNKC